MDSMKKILCCSLRKMMMTVEIEAYCHDERMSDDGGEAKADHEVRMKHSTHI